MTQKREKSDCTKKNHIYWLGYMCALSNHWTVWHSIIWPLESWTQDCLTIGQLGKAQYDHWTVGHSAQKPSDSRTQHKSSSENFLTREFRGSIFFNTSVGADSSQNHFFLSKNRIDSLLAKSLRKFSLEDIYLLWLTLVVLPLKKLSL